MPWAIVDPDLDRLVDFRVLYQKSSGSNWEPFGDYSGQTYLLVGKATGVPASSFCTYLLSKTPRGFTRRSNSGAVSSGARLG